MNWQMRVQCKHLPVALMLAGVVWAFSGCAGDHPRLHVILVVVDTLRADHMGMYGYARPTTPNIDAIAKEGTLFTRFYTPAGVCSATRSAIVTGMTELATVNDNRTKPNSPAWARLSVNSQRSAPEIPKTRPSA